MPEINTGVRKTLSFSATFSTHWRGPSITILGALYIDGTYTCFGSAGIPGILSIGVGPSYTSTNPPRYSGMGYDPWGVYQFDANHNAAYRLTATVIPSGSLSGSPTDAVGFFWYVDHPDRWGGTVSAEGSVDAELWMIYSDGADGHEVDIDGLLVPEFPGTSAHADGLPARQIRWEWRTYEGGTIQVDAEFPTNIFGHTLSASQTCVVDESGAGVLVVPEHEAGIDIKLTSGGAGTTVIDFSESISVSNQDFPDFSGSQAIARYEYSGSISIAGGSGSISIIGTSVPAGFQLFDEHLITGAKISGSPPYEYQVTGGFFGFKDTLSTPIKYVDSLGRESSSLNRTIRYPNYSVSSSSSWYDTDLATRRSISFGGSDLSGQYPFWLHIVPASLELSGDDRRDHRLQIGGRSFNAGTIRLARTSAIFGPATITGVASWTFTPGSPLNSEAYRYIRLRIKSSGTSKAYTFKLGSKSWAGVTGSADTYSNHLIDLCCPDGTAAGAYPSETKFPLTGPRIPGATPAPENIDPVRGVDRIASIILDGLDDTDTYTVEFCRFEVIESSLFTSSLLTFKRELLGWESASDSTYVRTSSWLNTDGRITDEAWMYRIASEDLVQWRFYSIEEAFAVLNEMEGITATLAGTWPDTYLHNQTSPALWLGGSTASIDQEIGTVESPQTVSARAMWDSVRGLPSGQMSGNLWIGSVAGGPLPCVINKFIRGQAWGIVMDADGEPVEKTVTLRRAGAGRGSGIPGARGMYQTTQPYGFGAQPHTLELAASSTPPAALAVANRMRHAVHWVDGQPETECASPFNLIDREGRYHRVHIAGGRVVHSRSEHESPPITASVVVSNGPSDAAPAIAMDHKERIVLVYERGGNVMIAFSADNGETYSTPTILMAGRIPTIAAHDDAPWIIVAGFVYDSGTSGPGQIRIRIWPPDEADFAAAIWIKNAGGSPYKFEAGGQGIVLGKSGSDRWILTAVAQGATEPSEWVSTDNGQTWEPL